MKCEIATALIFAISLPSGAAYAAAETAEPPGWDLLWSDEFIGDQLDPATWTRCRRGAADWMNTVSDDLRLVSVRDGVLRLEGIQNQDRADDPAPYLTGAVWSKGKFAFRYGKVQIRARFKSAQGAWPALWMLGADEPWPACGEIDLMEHLNFDDKVYQTIHSRYVHSDEFRGVGKPRNGETARIERDDWNTYGCEWDADRIVFTVNGEPTLIYPRVPHLGERQWPFDQPFYFILSMQIGGDWVNRAGPTDPAHFPAGMEIDWVRVYRSD